MDSQRVGARVVKRGVLGTVLFESDGVSPRDSLLPSSLSRSILDAAASVRALENFILSLFYSTPQSIAYHSVPGSPCVGITLGS